MKLEELVEKIAETLFNFENGISPDEYESIIGEKRKYSYRKYYKFQPPEIEQHERDEYRGEAIAVIDHLMRLGVIEIKDGFKSMPKEVDE